MAIFALIWCWFGLRGCEGGKFSHVKDLMRYMTRHAYSSDFGCKHFVVERENISTIKGNQTASTLVPLAK
jgi:hypothetical protein